MADDPSAQLIDGVGLSRKILDGCKQRAASFAERANPRIDPDPRCRLQPDRGHSPRRVDLHE